jgi:Ca-activated chloride channel family protein
MTELKVFLQGIRVRDMYPRQVGDLFDGDQILLVGRYDAGDVKKLPSEEGKGRSTLVVQGRYEGRQRAFEYPVGVNGVGRKAYQFVEKLWAIRRVGYLLDEIQLRGKSQEIIDELVRLSRDYGIMTPYTSFLADETTRLASTSDLRNHAKRAADELRTEVAGARGQMGADTRMRLNSAWNMAQGQARDGGAAMIGNAVQARYEEGQLERVANVRIVNNQALYQRGRVWIAANAAHVDLDREKDKLKDVHRFSKEYFELVRANTVMENQLLASQLPDEELVINLRGQTYRIR